MKTKRNFLDLWKKELEAAQALRPQKWQRYLELSAKTYKTQSEHDEYNHLCLVFKEEILKASQTRSAL